MTSSMNFKPEKKKPGSVRLSGWLVTPGRRKGQHRRRLGWDWSTTRTGNLDETCWRQQRRTPADGAKKEELGKVYFPFIAHGAPTLPAQETLLIKTQPTVWTGEAEGILINTDVLLKMGKSPASAELI